MGISRDYNNASRKKVSAVVGGITVVGTLTRSVLLHSIRDLMNVQCCLIRGFMLYEFELGNDTMQ